MALGLQSNPRARAPHVLAVASDAMAGLVDSRRFVFVVATALVIFAFWRALLAGGSLVGHDIVATVPPFDAYQPDDFTLEGGSGDPINIHAHWAPIATDVRAGDFSWWNRSLAGGQPTMKGGLPIFNLLYLIVPAWYAPGLVAAARTLTAIGLSVGFLRSAGLRWVSALVGGLAFGFSGFMVGWLNWPHSSVAALAPGLLWAIEWAVRKPRLWRSVPVGAVVAAMVWSNFPAVTVFVLFGAALYALIRVGAEHIDARRRRVRHWKALLGSAGAAVVLALGLAMPHVVGFSDYLGWADTSHREHGLVDTSAGPEYLLTAVTPKLWGSDALDVPWFGVGNWTEFNAHAGAGVIVLSVVGVVSGFHADRRRRSIVGALALIAAVGALVGYVGGPVALPIARLTGELGGLMTRAKVLLSLALAFLAAFAVDDVMDGWRAEDRRVKSIVRWSVGIFVLLAVAMVPSILHWSRSARDAGVLKETAAGATTSILAGVATIGVLVAAARRWITGSVVGWALVGVVSFELLSFAMPVPTTVSRAERLRVTPAHTAVLEALDPGEKLAGEGKTFFPGTTAHYDIDAALGPVLKTPGYQALLRAVDPAILELRGGGTPTYPNIWVNTDPGSPVWDAMGVGVWSQLPTSTPPGPIRPPDPGVADVDPGVEVLSGSTTVPDRGLRAVVVEAALLRSGLVTVEIEVEGTTFVDRRRREPIGRHQMPVAVLGEDLSPGAEVRVRVWTDDEGVAVVSTDADGALMLGTVGGDDQFRLIRTGDVLLTDRLNGSMARLFDAAVAVPDLDEAAAMIEDRVGQVNPAIVDSPLSLPTAADPQARLDVIATTIEPARATVDIDTDRASLLVVSQTNYRGWTATIDGQPADVLTAETTFTAVEVPAGRHVVVFEFAPTHLKSTMVVFLVTLGVAGTLLFVGVRPRRQRLGTGVQ